MKEKKQIVRDFAEIMLTTYGHGLKVNTNVRKRVEWEAEMTDSI
jgi:hypothetical protein